MNIRIACAGLERGFAYVPETAPRREDVTERSHAAAILDDAAKPTSSEHQAINTM